MLIYISGALKGSYDLNSARQLYEQAARSVESRVTTLISLINLPIEESRPMQLRRRCSPRYRPNSRI